MKNEHNHHLQYLKDEFGKEILLKNGSLQVMMEWEKPYMEACIDALQPSGDVLEIGFGLGYSATRIQKYHPKSHTIIECDSTVIQKAQEWAKDYSNIKIISGYWQDQLKDLGKFDAIFFDDYTPFNAEEVEEIESEIKRLQEAKNNMKKLHEELENTLKGAIKQENIQESNFFEEHDESSSKLVKKNFKHLDEGKAEPQIDVNSDRLIQFFQTCLDDHMHDGARMSSYIDFAQFKKQKQQFQDLIASRSDVSYTMQVIPIEVSSNCQYYAGNEALILTISKLKTPSVSDV